MEPTRRKRAAFPLLLLVVCGATDPTFVRPAHVDQTIVPLD